MGKFPSFRLPDSTCSDLAVFQGGRQRRTGCTRREGNAEKPANHADWSVCVLVNRWYYKGSISKSGGSRFYKVCREGKKEKEGNPFPAYLQDVKTAIRFLRAQGEEYGIDTERVAVCGSSSGGNTALLVGFTRDEERYKTEEYKEYSDKVKAVVECFGPTDLTENKERLRTGEAFEYRECFEALWGEPTPENSERLREMEPVYHLQAQKTCPPVWLGGSGFVLYMHNLSAVGLNPLPKKLHGPLKVLFL